MHGNGEKSISFIRNHSVSGYKKKENSRIEYFSYPARSVTEGIVNAIGHRNYFIQGSQIEINVFKNRLEITSPGSLLGVRELHEERNISSIIPRRRNDVICDVLEICRYMEEKGSGFDKIESDYEDYDERYKPFISADANSFTLVLPDLTSKTGIISNTEDNPEVYVEVILDGKSDIEILSFCYNKPRSVKEIAEMLSITPSTYFRKTVISRLVERGFLKELKTGAIKMFISNKTKVFLKG